MSSSQKMDWANFLVHHDTIWQMTQHYTFFIVGDEEKKTGCPHAYHPCCLWRHCRWSKIFLIYGDIYGGGTYWLRCWWWWWHGEIDVVIATELITGRCFKVLLCWEYNMTIPELHLAELTHFYITKYNQTQPCDSACWNSHCIAHPVESQVHTSFDISINDGSTILSSLKVFCCLMNLSITASCWHYVQCSDRFDHHCLISHSNKMENMNSLTSTPSILMLLDG